MKGKRMKSPDIQIRFLHAFPSIYSMYKSVLLVLARDDYSAMLPHRSGRPLSVYLPSGTKCGPKTGIPQTIDVIATLYSIVVQLLLSTITVSVHRSALIFPRLIFKTQLLADYTLYYNISHYGPAYTKCPELHHGRSERLRSVPGLPQRNQSTGV